MTTRLLIIAFFMSIGAFAQDEAEKPWSNETDFSLVITSGNTEATTLKLKNLYRYKWEKAEFSFKVDGLRVEDTDIVRTAVIQDGETVILTDEITETTAERYDVSLRYHRLFGERMKWFTDGKWTRDRFSGVENRTSVSAGVGHSWSDTEEYRFHTHYGLQYNREELSFEPAGYDDTYLGVTFGYDYRRDVFENSQFEQNMDVVYNTDESDDFRVKWETYFSTILTDRLSLKLGVDAHYDHEPGFTEVFFANGTDSVAVQLDDLDVVYTTSLTLRF